MLKRIVVGGKCIEIIFYLIAISMVWNTAINSVLIILASLITIIKHIILKSKFNFIENKFLLISWGLFLIKIISLIYTDNYKNGFFDIEKTLTFLIFPYIFYVNKESINVKNSLFCFSISVVFFLTTNFVKLYFHNPIELIHYQEESGFNIRMAFHDLYGIHPTYFSIYIIFVVFVILNSLKKITFINTIYFILSIFLVFIVWVLAARIVIIATIIIALTISILKFKKSFILYYLMSFFVIVGSMFIAYKYTPSVKTRFLEVVYSPKVIPRINEQMNATNIRIGIIECTKEVIQQMNWLTGVGIGDTQDVLNTCYKVKEFAPNFYIENYNFHNQYIQYFVGLGIIGLLLYFIMIMFPLYIGYKRNSILLISLAMLMLITSSTECLMGMQKGIVFFGFMINLLLIKEIYISKE